MKNTKYNMPMSKLDPNGMNEFCFFIDSELNPDIDYSYKTFLIVLVDEFSFFLKLLKNLLLLYNNHL